jgi:MerR family transcriptional regulator, light-induced transcriptional regulator
VPEILEACEQQWLDMLGLSVSYDCHVDAVRAIVAQARLRSRNPNLIVLVGGSLCERIPDLATQVGADLSADSAPQAVQLAAVALAKTGNAVSG